MWLREETESFGKEVFLKYLKNEVFGVTGRLKGPSSDHFEKPHEIFPVLMRLLLRAVQKRSICLKYLKLKYLLVSGLTGRLKDPSGDHFAKLRKIFSVLTVLFLRGRKVKY